jgi:hypothetical protein
MDDEDINDISGIANDLSNMENTLEISLFKNNRSIEPKQAPKYEDDNFFDGYDNSMYTADDQEQEEYNNSQKAIYMETLTKLENLQTQQEVSALCKCADAL